MTAPTCIWTEEGVQTILGPDACENGAAYSLAEQISSRIETASRRRIVVRDMRPHLAVPDRIIAFPSDWSPNPSVTSVRHSAEGVGDSSAWPAVEGWRQDDVLHVIHPGVRLEKLRDQYSRMYLPNVRIDGRAGILNKQIGEDLVMDGDDEFSDLISAAVDVLRSVWGRRQSNPTAEASRGVEGVNMAFAWQEWMWPRHVRQAIKQHRRVF